MAKMKSQNTIHRKRMMKFFLEAAKDILNDEGIEGLSVRKVADKSGYNLATLYNYFDNIKHLLFYASIGQLTSYVEDLSRTLKENDDPQDIYLKSWRCFCDHSYNNPDTFYNLFFNNYSDENVDDSIKTYFEIFPDEINDNLTEYLPMLTENNIYERNFFLLKRALQDVTISDASLVELNEMTVLIYEGILNNIKTGLINDKKDAVEKSMTYIQILLEPYGIKRKADL